MVGGVCTAWPTVVVCWRAVSQIRPPCATRATSNHRGLAHAAPGPPPKARARAGQRSEWASAHRVESSRGRRPARPPSGAGRQRHKARGLSSRADPHDLFLPTRSRGHMRAGSRGRGVYISPRRERPPHRSGGCDHRGPVVALHERRHCTRLMPAAQARWRGAVHTSAYMCLVFFLSTQPVQRRRHAPLANPAV